MQLKFSVLAYLASFNCVLNDAPPSFTLRDVSFPSAILSDRIYANHKNCLFLTLTV